MITELAVIGVGLVLMAMTLFFVLLDAKRMEEKDAKRPKEDGVIIEYQKILSLVPNCYYEVSIAGRKILKDAGITEIYHGMKIPCYTGEEKQLMERVRLRCVSHKIPVSITRGKDLICW